MTWALAFQSAILYQLLSARVPVQTLTEHGLKRECWQAQPRQKEAPDELSPSGPYSARSGGALYRPTPGGRY